MRKFNYHSLVASLIIPLSIAVGFYINSVDLKKGIPTKPDFVIDVDNDGKPDAFYIVRSKEDPFFPNSQTRSYVAFVDGNSLEKIGDKYLRHSSLNRIPGTKFISRSNSDLSLLVGNFNDVDEGIDIEVVEAVTPDFGVNSKITFYDVSLPK